MSYCNAQSKPEAEAIVRSSKSHVAIAEALLYLKLQGLAPAELEAISGFKDYTIRHYLRIAQKLAPSVKRLLHSNMLTFSMARTIASLPTEKQEEEARRTLYTRTSVHKLRARLNANNVYSDDETARYFARLADTIALQSGLNVTIVPQKDNSHAGILTLRYTDLREFDAICAKLGVDLSEL